MTPIKDHNPTRTFPVVTVVLIVVNVVVFLAQLVLGKPFTYLFAMIPANVVQHPFDQNAIRWSGEVVTSGLPVWTTVLTSMFLHGGWMHLGGNMLYLWIFGNNTEDE